MIKKFKDFWKNFDQKILKPEKEEPQINFKGQRIQQKQGSPYPTQEQYESQFKLDPEIRMQSRRLRLKNLGYLTMFMGWYAAVVLFIMYRLKSDDLETLEKEAEERLKLQKQVEELRKK